MNTVKASVLEVHRPSEIDVGIMGAKLSCLKKQGNNRCFQVKGG